MTDKHEADQDELHDKAMLVKQSLKFADDLVKVYEQEKAKRLELEAVNAKLQIEISERRKAEEGLRVSEERFRTIFETVQDSIFIKNTSLQYTHINPAMEQLLQLSNSQILGKTDSDLYGSEVSKHLSEVDKRILQGETIEKEHTRLINGVPITFLETRCPWIDGSGNIKGILGLARDITDRAGKDRLDTSDDQLYPSRVMRKALADAEQVATQDTVVLLLGESGSGKDYMASHIHANSPRANGPFFAINCASLPPELAETELFGHEAGAFTGARARKRGQLELAEGGTLFLNEIGDLSLPLQAKLLTFLDTKTFTKVGGEKHITVNARLIAATNKNLQNEVEKKQFRQDLFYRLNVFSIEIPPLRKRKQDIPVLVDQLVAQMQSEMRLTAPPMFPLETMELLQTYSWPGNVRELRNVLERALILSGGGRIGKTHIGIEGSGKAWAFSTEFPEKRSLNDVTRDLKRALIEEALVRSGGNKVAAAKLLGISRNSLNHYLSSLGVETQNQS